MPHDLFATNSHEFSRIDQKIRATSRKFVAEVLSFPLITVEPLTGYSNEYDRNLYAR